MIKIEKIKNLAIIRCENCSRIDNKDVISIAKILNQLEDKRIAIDLNFIESICNEFFILIKKFQGRFRLSLYNISFNIFNFLFLSNNYCYVDLFLNKSNFQNQKFPITHRHFVLVKNKY